MRDLVRAANAPAKPTGDPAQWIHGVWVQPGPGPRAGGTGGTGGNGSASGAPQAAVLGSGPASFSGASGRLPPRDSHHALLAAVANEAMKFPPAQDPDETEDDDSESFM